MKLTEFTHLSHETPLVQVRAARAWAHECAMRCQKNLDQAWQDLGDAEGRLKHAQMRAAQWDALLAKLQDEAERA